MQSCARFTLLTIAVAALAVGAQPAQAQEVIDLGSGFACEGTRALGDHTSTATDVLTIVGYVVNFNPPFADLDANDPTKEYTYVYTGFTSGGTGFPGVGFEQYVTNYGAGTLEIYCDVSKDSDFADKATFGNGDLIVSFSVPGLTTKTFIQFGTDICAGNTEPEDLTVTGGSHADRLEECPIVRTNAGTVIVCTNIAAEVPAGYFGKIDTKIDADCPVPAEPKTWGNIKRTF